MKDCSTISNLYISGLAREGNPAEFLQYENHPFPVFLSDHGKLSPPGYKGDLVECLVKSLGHIPVLNAPVVYVKIFDGPAVVHLLQPKRSVTFDDYAKDIFLPYLEKCLQDTSRGDIVWDVYHTDTRLATFLGICDYLCVPVVAYKMEKGACLAFLGVTLDTIKMEARLPQDKLDTCLTLVKN